MRFPRPQNFRLPDFSKIKRSGRYGFEWGYCHIILISTLFILFKISKGKRYRMVSHLKNFVNTCFGFNRFLGN